MRFAAAAITDRWSVSASLLLATLLISPSLSASILLAFNSNSPASTTDCKGIALALEEAGITHSSLDLATDEIALPELALTQVLVACDLSLNPDQAELLGDWVAIGGGLLATGSSGFGMEATLGLDSLAELATGSFGEIRFVQEHPVTTGSWWDGVITGPQLPASERPTVTRHYYFNQDWPGYVAIPDQATVLAHWHDVADDWEQSTGAPALVAHHDEEGRAVYSGALPGTYSDWDWPRAWRILIVSAIEWLSWQEPLVSLGYWPDAHRGAFSWTGDTEMPAMETAVVALLDIFANHDLERFGTFYTVGKSGGDAGTVGAVEYPHITEAIIAAGSELAGHGDVHSSFSGQDYATQRSRLEAMQTILDPFLAPDAISGFRAPYLSQDATTWQALADLGFGHDAGEADVWTQATLPHPIGGMLQLPPSMLMDWHIFELYGLPAATAQAIWLDKLDYVISRRGLFSWLHHPWVIEDHVEIVDHVLGEAVARGDLWMARQDDIARWWQKREQVLVETIPILPDGSINIHVVNSGPSAADGLSIWIRVPDGTTSPWYARADGTPVPLIERWHGDALFRVAVLPELAADTEALLEVTTETQIFRDRFEQAKPADF